MTPESVGDALANADPAPEWAKVEAWRLHQLIEAGYPVTIAEQLAADSLVDLHKALEMRERGCPAATAAEILLS